MFGEEHGDSVFRPLKNCSFGYYNFQPLKICKLISLEVLEACGSLSLFSPFTLRRVVAAAAHSGTGRPRIHHASQVGRTRRLYARCGTETYVSSLTVERIHPLRMVCLAARPSPLTPHTCILRHRQGPRADTRLNLTAVLTTGPR